MVGHELIVTLLETYLSAATAFSVIITDISLPQKSIELVPVPCVLFTVL